MTVSTPAQPDYNNQSSSSAYALNIDACLAAYMRGAGMFAPHARATAASAIEVDPGVIYDPRTQTLTQVGCVTFCTTANNSASVTAIQSTAGMAAGQGIRDNLGAIPANDTIAGITATAPYAGALTLAAATGASGGQPSLQIVTSQIVSGFTAPANNPRIDRVVIDGTTGAASIVAGTENPTPTVPAIPAGTLPCCQIYFTVAGDATVTGNMITDERAVWSTTIPGIPYASAAGSANALTAAFTPATSNPPYVGELLMVQALGANTVTNPTFAPDGNTAYQITKQGGQALAAGDIAGPGHELLFCYRGSYWELLNPALNLSANLDAFGSARGDVLYRAASGWAALGPGTSGQFLKTNGAGADPAWATIQAGVTSFNGRQGAITLSTSDWTGAMPTAAHSVGTYVHATYVGSGGNGGALTEGSSYAGSTLQTVGSTSLPGTWMCMSYDSAYSLGSGYGPIYAQGLFLRTA